MREGRRAEERHDDPLAHALSRETVGFTVAGQIGLARGLHQAGIIVPEQAAKILEAIASEYETVGRLLHTASDATLQHIGEAAKVLREAADEVREG